MNTPQRILQDLWICEKAKLLVQLQGESHVDNAVDSR